MFMCSSYGGWYTCGHRRGIETVALPEAIPVCTERPKECGLCDLMRMIYEGFPSQVDPGCETAQAKESANDR